MLWSTVCPIVTVKSLDNLVNHKIQVELNSYADTSVVGSNVLVVHDHECNVDIYGCDSKSRHRNITTADAAVAYDNPQTGDRSALIINQAILIPSMKIILLCPMQSYLNDVSVNDMSKFLLKNPTMNDHAVIIPSDVDDCSLLILLMLQGVTSYFKYDSDVIPKFHLTAEAPMWDPDSSSYSLQEECTLDFRGHIVSTVTTTRGQITLQVNAVCRSPFAPSCVIDTTDDNNFSIYLESYVQISLTSTSRRTAVIHDMLAKCWGINPDCAKDTVQCSTQRAERCTYDSKPCIVSTFLDKQLYVTIQVLMSPDIH